MMVQLALRIYGFCIQGFYQNGYRKYWGESVALLLMCTV